MRSPAIAACLFALSVAPVAADESAKWGAIAFGGASRISGTAMDRASAGEAREAALDACAGQCTQTMVFQRNRGAVAASASGATGWSRGRWRDRAIARALTQCRQRSADCALVAWACTAH